MPQYEVWQPVEIARQPPNLVKIQKMKSTQIFIPKRNLHHLPKIVTR